MKIKNDLRGSLMDMRLQKLGENENDEKKNAKLKRPHIYSTLLKIFYENLSCSCLVYVSVLL